MLNFKWFGIPFVGANSCGYSGNATVNLCARWMQLGAFYPFMRNHNSPEGSPQEPYTDPKLMSVSKKALKLRYSLVRYIYTEYMHTVLRGGSLIKPLVFLFPEDNDTYSTVDISFMMGPGLRITPILEDNKDFVETYFPNTDWYHFLAPDFKQVLAYNHTSTKGKVIQVHSSIDGETINVHMRAGAIVPYQEATDGTTNVLMLHDLPIILVVAPNQHGKAVGELLYDTEHHSRFYEDHQDIMMHMHDSNIDVNHTSGRRGLEYNHTDMYIRKITILNAEHFKDTTAAKYYVNSPPVHKKTPHFDSANSTLTLQPAATTSMP